MSGELLVVDTREVLGITLPPSADALQLPVCRIWHRAPAAPLPPAATKVPRAHLGSCTRCLPCCSPGLLCWGYPGACLSSVQASTRCCFFCPVPREPPARGLRPSSFLHTLLKSHRPAVASSFSVGNAGHVVEVRLDMGRRRRAPERERALWFGALGSRVRACWAAASAEIPMWWLKGKKVPA